MARCTRKQSARVCAGSRDYRERIYGEDNTVSTRSLGFVESGIRVADEFTKCGPFVKPDRDAYAERNIHGMTLAFEKLRSASCSNALGDVAGLIYP